VGERENNWENYWEFVPEDRENEGEIIEGTAQLMSERFPELETTQCTVARPVRLQQNKRKLGGCRITLPILT
jgi:hypothetical protein